MKRVGGQQAATASTRFEDVQESLKSRSADAFIYRRTPCRPYKDTPTNYLDFISFFGTVHVSVDGFSPFFFFPQAVLSSSTVSGPTSVLNPKP